MSPEDRAEIQEIVCLVERDLQAQNKKSERSLIILELVLLPVAIAVLVMYPVAGWVVFLPNAGIRTYQMLRGGKDGS